MTRFGDNASQLSGAAAMLLGWRPGEFWNATPAELAAALQARSAEGPDRQELSALMRRFPDEMREAHG